MAQTPFQVLKDRLSLSALGGGASWALWALGRNWDQAVIAPLAYVALVTFVATWCGVALALSGPMRLGRAIGGALGLAIPVTGLACLAALRMQVATDLLEDPATIILGFVFVLFATPFLSVWLQDRSEWYRYGALFQTGWAVGIRCGVALLFVGLFWVLLALSDRLLQLVDINVLEALMRMDGAPYALSGAVFGLGLSVVYELRQTISPLLVLRLLRLLVPAVLVVIAVFLIALPMRGLSHLFGSFSAAGTLMSAAIVSVALVSAALDQDETHEVKSPVLRIATLILACVQPLLAGLAVWAVLVRVLEYGWTPDRLLAMVIAGLLLGYALGYAVAGVTGAGWTGRIRAVNVVMAGVVMLVCVAWMTPALSPYRIATASQVERYLSWEMPAGDLPLWAMAHTWGRAGQKGLDRLAQSGDVNMARLVQAARDEPSAFRFENHAAGQQGADKVTKLAALMPVLPDGQGMEAEDLEKVPLHWIEPWLDGCERSLPDGRAGCVMVLGEFAPIAEARQAMVVYLTDPDEAKVSYLLQMPGATPVIRQAFDPAQRTWPVLRADDLAAILDGTYQIGPTGQNALILNNKILAPSQ